MADERGYKGEEGHEYLSPHPPSREPLAWRDAESVGWRDVLQMMNSLRAEMSNLREAVREELAETRARLESLVEKVTRAQAQIETRLSKLEVTVEGHDRSLQAQKADMGTLRQRLDLVESAQREDESSERATNLLLTKSRETWRWALGLIAAVVGVLGATVLGDLLARAFGG
jgi:chromosome segregation ATPase